MKLSKTNLWDSESDLICVTTNGCIGTANQLVMGKGSAGEAQKRSAQLAKIAGNAIIDSGSSLRVGSAGTYDVFLYGFITVEFIENPGNPFGQSISRLGLFQTKLLYSKQSLLSVIGFSTTLLNCYLRVRKNISIAMPFPGIGYGKLRRQDVLPIIKELPDTVIVHEYN